MIILRKLKNYFFQKFVTTLIPVHKLEELVVELPNGLVIGTDAHRHSASVIKLKIFSWKVFPSFFWKGVLGLAESYIDGKWEVNDLPRLLSKGVQKRSDLKNLRGRFFSKIFDSIKHKLKENSVSNSKKNIAFHYDLGNQFYASWLDETMTYSSAIFVNEQDSLRDAQTQKYESLLDMGRLQDSHDVLEVGCGWGGLLEHISLRNRCNVKGITISQNQFNYAKKRISGFHNSDNVSVQMCDYRHVDGKYDRIFSIEMIEAVGERYWPIFFRSMKELLRPNGELIIQAITINDAAFSAYRLRPDFIQMYIFPGGMLMSPSVMKEIALREGLAITQKKCFGAQYAKTLKLWRARFNKAWSDRLRHEGYDDNFRRMWNFYLAYCEAGFNEKYIDVEQVKFLST